MNRYRKCAKEGDIIACMRDEICTEYKKLNNACTLPNVLPQLTAGNLKPWIQLAHKACTSLACGHCCDGNSYCRPEI